ncbi:MAG TPA: tetratricopeptide repeat protein [Candidatus Acidoferrales bacterium]|nr:tetratricopeptide repeat protein [Candidatus Acidoferrales bacterium]
MILANIIILAVIAAGTWWLTGFDKTAGGESKRGHHLTRALRCIAVVFLSMVFVWFLEAPPGPGGIPILIITPLCIAIVLRSSLSEVLAHGFVGLVDPMLRDHREFDPKKMQRHQDAIAYLIHHGRREEAIKLCEELKQSGEVDMVTLENALEFLGVKPADRKPANPLAEAARLRTQGKFGEAEALLRSLLEKNPADDGAAIMLMRLYAQDRRQPERAYQVLSALEKQPHVPAAHLEFARRSIPDWSTPQPGGTGAATVESGVPPDSARAEDERATPSHDRTERARIPPERTTPEAPTAFDLASVDQLLAQGALGSAVEMLEREMKARPLDWGLQLKLAEVYAVHCKEVTRAEKIARRLEQTSNLPPDYAILVRAKLAEWRALEEGRVR